MMILATLVFCCWRGAAHPQRHHPPGRGNTMALKDELNGPWIVPKNSLTSLLKPIEKEIMICFELLFCLLLLKRCCSPTTLFITSLLKPIENDDFSYFCLLLLKRCCSPTKTPPSRTGKHHGPEGRPRPRIAQSLTSLLKPIENDVMILATFLSSAAEEVLLTHKKLSNVASETHRTWWF